jgi:glycosyltransferase involved in cell wall biosynthesis
VPPGDLFALAKTLEDVMQNPKLQAEMTQKGKQHAQRFQGQTMAKETLAVYESL